MELSHLRAFVVVVEERHFGRAALRLERSQPQVSRLVRALEAELGVELFLRTARQVELTDAGRRLLADARDALAAVDRVAEQAAGLRRGQRGRVTVAFLWSTLGGYLAPLVSAAAERHPEIELGVSQISFLEVLPALRRGDVELVLGRSLFEATEMTEITLRREPSVVAVAELHPFAGRERIPYDAVRGEPVIALRRALVPAAYDAMLAAARRRGHEPNIVRHARTPSEALALAAAGVGLYRLPASAAAPFPGLAYVEIEDTPSRLVLIHRPVLPPSARVVVELIIKRFGDASNASDDATSALVAPRAAT